MAEDQRDEKSRFLTGNNGGPGRPKGSRNKLGEAFLSDLLDDWEAHGVKAIADVRADKPDQYLKVVASTLPRELNIKVSELDELTDEQIGRQLSAIAAQLAAAGFGIGEGAGPEAAAQFASGVPTVQ